jgi:hypothetical protein
LQPSQSSRMLSSVLPPPLDTGMMLVEPELPPAPAPDTSSLIPPPHVHPHPSSGQRFSRGRPCGRTTPAFFGSGQPFFGQDPMQSVGRASGCRVGHKTLQVSQNNRFVLSGAPSILRHHELRSLIGNPRVPEDRSGPSDIAPSRSSPVSTTP